KGVKPKIVAIVDEAGNVLFGSGNPGKVEVTNFPAAAATVAPGAASQIRTLISVSAGNTSAACADNVVGLPSHAFDNDVRPGGGGVYESFSIPPGQVFLVTGVDWVASGVAASTNYTVELKFETMAGYNVSSALSVALADSTNHAGNSMKFGTPLVLHSNNRLCLRGDGTAANLSGTAQGFFAPDA